MSSTFRFISQDVNDIAFSSFLFLCKRTVIFRIRVNDPSVSLNELYGLIAVVESTKFIYLNQIYVDVYPGWETYLAP